MKKLYSTVTGVDQGVTPLFSDFESDGEMWSGDGERTRRVSVTFSEPFKSAPSVQVTMELLDMHHGTNHRTVLKADGITESGFDIVFRTWGDTRIARARAARIAIGEAKGDEDWDIDYGS